ncbi:MAG: AMP-binding protein [Myxococcota bacterium]|jgi:acetyl-CoA synthetase|nr:AMP-binding protein [Myxococcota bacterium]
MTDNLKADLLGLSAIDPPARLKGRGPGATLEGYREYLTSCARDSAGLWLKVASELRWDTAPSGLGGPGGWFLGGSMNLAASCLVGEQDALAVLEAGSQGVERFATSDLRTRIGQAVSALRRLALAPRDRVLVSLPLSVDWLACVLACAELGLCCVPVNPHKGAAQVTAFAAAAECRAVVVPDGFEKPAVRFALAASDLRAEGPSNGVGPLPSMHPFLLLSDSAGQMFTIPLAGFMVQAAAAFEALLAPAGEGALWLATPGNYASTLAIAFAALRSERALGLIDPAQLDSPAALWRACETCRPELLVISARTAQIIVETADTPPPPDASLPAFVAVEGEQFEPRCYGALRRIVLGGRAHVVQILGRPEAGGLVAGPQPAVTPIRPSSVCFGAPGLEIAIVDHSGQGSPAGLGGLLALSQSTPALAMELQEVPPPIALEVKARLDHKGYLWTMGETKVLRQAVDLGAGTAEIEALIASLEDVEQVAVVRFQDPTGSCTHAFVKPIRTGQFDVEAATLLIASKAGVAAEGMTFQVVERLPYSRSGKLLRSVLRRVAAGEPMGLDDASLVTDPQTVADLLRR